MKRALLIVLVLMIISTVWCQNGTPTVLSAPISVPGNNVNDFVAINDYCYIANDQFLTKYELSSRNILWSKPFPNFYGNGNGQGMFKTGNNLVYTYDGIVTKMTVEDDTLWQVTLPGRVALSLDSTRNRVVCYSWTGLLTVLNLDNGQTLLQQQMPFEGLKNTAYHSAIAVSDNEFITADNTIYGVNYNSATLVSKIIIVNGVANVIWQHPMPDLTTCNIKSLSGNCFYLSLGDIGGASNARIFFFEDLGSNFAITGSVDMGGPDVPTFLEDTLPFGNNVLTVGMNILGDDINGEDGRQAVFTIYDNQGETRTAQVNNQTDFTTYQGLAESSGRIYTVLLTQTYIGGPVSFFLTELTDIYNSAVSIDPDTPVAPQVSLTCYPTPTRVGNNVNVRFESKSRDNVTIEVYNIKGQKVKTLVNQSLSSGEHQTVWNGKTENNQPVASGMYFFRMKSGNFTATRKIILMK